jgi:hypothetical protein
MLRSGRDAEWFVRHAAMIFAPLARLISPGTHKPALRGEPDSARPALDPLMPASAVYAYCLSFMEISARKPAVAYSRRNSPVSISFVN